MCKKLVASNLTRMRITTVTQQHRSRDEARAAWVRDVCENATQHRNMYKTRAASWHFGARRPMLLGSKTATALLFVLCFLVF